MNELRDRPESISQNFPKFPNSENRLNENQYAAIDLLLLGKSLSVTARTLGVDRRTVLNWRQEDCFRDELAHRRRKLWSEPAERLSGMVHPALNILDEQLNDNYDRCRFRAAKTVLTLAAVSRSIQALNEEE